MKNWNCLDGIKYTVADILGSFFRIKLNAYQRCKKYLYEDQFEICRAIEVEVINLYGHSSRIYRMSYWETMKLVKVMC